MNNYFRSDKIIEAFDFLLQNGFKIVNQNDSNMGTSVEFSNDIIRIHLTFDYRDYFFYFSIIKGKETKYPNDTDHHNIISFLRIGKKYVPNFSPNELFPSESNSSIEALAKNAQFLQSYGKKILTGEEWI